MDAYLPFVFDRALGKPMRVRVNDADDDVREVSEEVLADCGFEIVRQKDDVVHMEVRPTDVLPDDHDANPSILYISKPFVLGDLARAVGQRFGLAKV